MATYLAGAYASQAVEGMLASSAPTVPTLYLSIHSASPGTTGANELAAGTAYSQSVRQTLTFAAASAGTIVSNDTQTYTLSSGTAVTYFGIWTASSGGTYITGGPTNLSGTIPSGANVVFTNGITLTITG